MVGPAGPETDAGPVVKPQPARFGLLLWVRWPRNIGQVFKVYSPD